ncbi:hypothetical protein [Actinoplanes sp. GCM10030250]|uniref:hypothetical protein n=1 Tax=Actinoplanes sp. GCM10030250 TaxID=3273376 RepID=UPI0036191271
MVRYDEGGSGPTGVGHKLDVKVESLKTLSTELLDDLKDFEAEYERWDTRGSVMHPLSAQYIPKGSSTAFAEAVEMHGKNVGSYTDVNVKVQFIRKGIEALQKAAADLAETYKNLDEANALSVSKVEMMFPEPGKPGTPTEKLPPADQWKVLPDGFDLNNDGIISEKDGDIPFAATPSGKKPDFSGENSKHDTPEDEKYTERAGYTKPQDLAAPTQEESGVFHEAYEEYHSRVAEDAQEAQEAQEKAEKEWREGTVEVTAPGAPGTSSGNNGGTVA